MFTTGSDSLPRYEFVSVKKLRPNDYNPNRMTDAQFVALQRAIMRDGFCGVLLVNETPAGFVIIDGEHRWRAAKRLHLDSIPCLIGSFTDETAKMLTVKLNQIHGEWNAADLVALLESIPEPLADLGFSKQEFAAELELAMDEVTGSTLFGQPTRSGKRSAKQYVGFMLDSKQQRLLKKALDAVARRLNEPMLSRSDALEQILTGYLCKS